MNTTDVNRTLRALGYEQSAAGVKAFQACKKLTLDGIAGPKTIAALSSIDKRGMLKTADIYKKFGNPGDDANFTFITLPFPKRVAWDLKSTISRMQCHKAVANQLQSIWTETLNVYGIEEIKRLGLDLYGGCYNFRKMRGGDDWSRHAWAIAEDVNPAENSLKATAKTARLARPEFIAFWQIVYKNGFVSQGIEKGFDWMHFEAAP